jgi:hypothetical protein
MIAKPSWLFCPFFDLGPLESALPCASQPCQTLPSANNVTLLRRCFPQSASEQLLKQSIYATSNDGLTKVLPSQRLNISFPSNLCDIMSFMSRKKFSRTVRLAVSGFQEEYLISGWSSRARSMRSLLSFVPPMPPSVVRFAFALPGTPCLLEVIGYSRIANIELGMNLKPQDVLVVLKLCTYPDVRPPISIIASDGLI